MATAPTLEAARQVHSVLEDAGIRALVIGAVALAAHGYVRGTEDFDFAISVPPQRLPELSERFRRLFPSWDVQCNESDANDPSGGVIHIECPGDDLCVVEVVNFDNSPAGGFPALVENAETLPFIFPNGPQGRLVSLEDLILFKLYAGGTKSRADVDELLARRKVDLTRLTTLATKYGMLGELRLVIPEAATQISTSICVSPPGAARAGWPPTALEGLWQPGAARKGGENSSRGSGTAKPSQRRQARGGSSPRE